MNPDFWLERWHRSQIGFHQTQVERCLRQHWGNADIGDRYLVFVPLCGKSRDLLWLRAQGHEVIGVELSELAAEAFFVENGVPARRRTLTVFDRYETPDLTFLRGDFFDLTSAMLGDVSAIYDRAALISWEPESRAAYVEHLAEVAPKCSSIFIITLEYPQTQSPGPPFSVEFAEVERLYSARYSIQELARRDALANEPKMRDRGVSIMFEVCYRLMRRGQIDER
jgi:thiopurine S-methyltransferase